MVVLIGDNNPVHVVTGNGSWSLEFALSFSTLSKLVLESAFFIIDFNSVVGSIGHHDQTWFSAVYTPWAAKLTPGLPFWPECGFWHIDFSVVATYANVNLKKKIVFWSVFTILHRDLRNDLFFFRQFTFSNFWLDCFSPFLFGLLFLFLDFGFFFRLLFLFWAFISLFAQIAIWSQFLPSFISI